MIKCPKSYLPEAKFEISTHPVQIWRLSENVQASDVAVTDAVKPLTVSNPPSIVVSASENMSGDSNQVSNSPYGTSL